MLILGYHSIHSERRDALAVHPRCFEEQVEWLRSRHSLVPLAEVVRAYVAGNAEPDLAAITFDDGLRDNYEVLFPIVKRLGIPVTIFVALDWIGTERVFEGENISKNQTIEARDLRGMTWQQVREMGRHGITFGSHTFTHRRLPQLSDESIDREVADSRAFLEERLQLPVEFFCYPFGDFDERSIEAVRRAGYIGAVATPMRSFDETVFTLRRVGVYQHNSLSMLRFKASRLGMGLQRSGTMRKLRSTLRA